MRILNVIVCVILAAVLTGPTAFAVPCVGTMGLPDAETATPDSRGSSFEAPVPIGPAERSQRDQPDPRELHAANHSPGGESALAESMARPHGMQPAAAPRTESTPRFLAHCALLC